MNQDLASFKRMAAEHAVTFVKPGMVVGLGHGSTAIWAVRRIADRIHSGELRDIAAIPCSLTVERDARELGIPLATLEEQPAVDITIDGADEVDPALNVIKGGGGALLREKIVGQATKRYVIIVDESKCSPTLGTTWPVPVEVLPFGLRAHTLYLESIGATPKLRRATDGQPFNTDQGNLILDCAFGPIPDPRSIAQKLNEHAGIVGHGLFLGMATDLIVAGSSGIRHETCAR
ncbi:MAG: ribose-5-phosphate isomerase RpiA [Candidatus Hydrogenedentes bacterium]|nr:ribose-5-phosphate isomerase RpiA [Candidatus Hydrogenedentota bacterium]